jgi:hypothetical protein
MAVISVAVSVGGICVSVAVAVAGDVLVAVLVLVGGKYIVTVGVRVNGGVLVRVGVSVCGSDVEVKITVSVFMIADVSVIVELAV